MSDSTIVLDAVQARKKHEILPLLVKDGQTDPVSLHFTCGNGWKDVAEEMILTYGMDPDQEIYGHGATPLHFACTSGNLEIVQYLLSLGCNVFKYTKDGLTVLHCAVMGGLDIIKYFTSLDYDLEVSLKFHTPETKLLAYYNWSNELIKYLLVDKSLNTIVDHGTGDTLLHYACRDGRLDRVRFLIEKCHCNPNTVNKNCDTALHTFCSSATISGEIAEEIIGYFLGNEFYDHSKLNAQSHSILDCAVMSKKCELVKYLTQVFSMNILEYFKTNYISLAYSNSYWDDDIIKYLIIELECPLVTNAVHGDTVLHDVCRDMDIRKLKFLVEECGCDPDAFTGQEKNSLLHAFCSSNTHPSHEVLVYLKLKCLSYMFMHKAINHFGYTPLEWAIFNSNPFVVPIVRCLIEEYGSHKLGSENMERILALAYKRWSNDLIKYLLVEIKCSPIINGNHILQKLFKDHRFTEIDFLLGIDDFLHSNEDILPDLISNEFSLDSTSHNEAIFSMIFDSKNPLYQAIRSSFIRGCVHLPLSIIKTSIKKIHYIHTQHYPEFLKLVTQYWNEAVIKYLLVEVKVDTVECTDNVSSIHVAIVTAACKELSRVKFLVESCNYNPNAVNSEGETLVHIAANTGTFNILQYLFIECKCQPNLNGHEAGTMAMKTAIAQKERGIFIIKHLVEKCKVESNCKIMSCAYTNWCDSIIQYLVGTAGFDPTVNSTTGFTIFHQACISGTIEQLKFVADRLCDGCINLANSALPLLFQIACHNIKKNAYTSVITLQYNTDILQYCMSCNCCPTVDKADILAAVDYYIVQKIDKGVGVAQYLIERCGSSLTTADFSSMLLKAYSVWYEEMILYLTSKTQCINLQTGDTVLHMACRECGELKKLKFLLMNCKCDVIATNLNRETILHTLILKGCDFDSFRNGRCEFDSSHLEIIQNIMKFIPKENLESIINKQDIHGNTVLHSICSSKKVYSAHTKLSYLSYFFELIQHNSFQNNKGLTVLHMLCDKYTFGHSSDILAFIRTLIENNKCNHLIPDKNMDTILHHLVLHPRAKDKYDHQRDQLLSLIRYLIYDCHMDITSKNAKGESVLQGICQWEVGIDLIEELVITCKVDLLTLCFEATCDLNPPFVSLLTRLIKEGKGDYTIKDSNSNSILHLLVLNNVVYSPEFLSLIHHLIYNCQCDVTSQNKYGETVLHVACRKYNGDVSLIEQIMLTGKADMLKFNKFEKSPLMILDDRCCELNNDDAIIYVNQLISSFGEIQLAHPIHSYVNVILLGNPGAGKSTLAKVIEDRKKYANITAQYRKVRGVELHTAGIIPKVLNDKDIGRVILHDLAGQAEYYSSHTAVLENLLQGSAAVFVLVVSLADESFIKSLNLWLNVIKNVSHKSLHQCQLIIVTSHIDHSIVIDLDLLTHSIGDLCSSTASTILKYHGVFNLDCRKLGGNHLANFISALSAGCKLISDANINKEMSLYCHMLYDFFLRDRKPVYTLETLIHLAKEVNGLFLPDGISHVDSIISILSSTGLIVFLRNPSMLKNSWIVADKSILLKDLDGILFAPQDFKEHVNISSNIGVVKLSDLQSLFPNYDPELLLQFLQYMELCSIISNDFIEANTSTPLTNTSEQYIFVPALIKSIDKPAEISQSAFKFGWKLCCLSTSFFLSRFLHLVQLHLACKYSVDKSAASSKFERFCKIWTRGLYWKDTKGVQTLVELADSNQTLIVLTSCEDGAEAEILNLIHDVVNEILLCKQQAMPRVSTQEFIIDSSSLQLPQCSTSLNSSSVPLYSVELLARCAINNDRFILDTSGEKQLAITKLIAVPDVCQQQIFKAVFASRDPKDLANGDTKIAVNRVLTCTNTLPTLSDQQSITTLPNTEDSVDSNSFTNEDMVKDNSLSLSDSLNANSFTVVFKQDELPSLIRNQSKSQSSSASSIAGIQQVPSSVVITSTTDQQVDSSTCTASVNAQPTDRTLSSSTNGIITDPKDSANMDTEITLHSVVRSCTDATPTLSDQQGITAHNTEDSVDPNSFTNEEESTDSELLQVLKSHTPDLLRLISDPNKLANDLWSVDLLTFEEKAEIQTMSHAGIITKSTSLLNVFILRLLSYKLSERKREFEMIMKFCNVLKNQDDPPLSRIADEIMEQISP